ncbi:hypothetical protein N867_02495 [Actinotalea fermentans ATCC 43279 = JCM 9966 = DSM 3133]|uniref:Uncharacterized protein n=1 Tax=Actinotalea fermentans TaxID=43671 RepID=A0A511Z1X5_9CELL|nr:hypothetical protein N867_02495 [Actinotalea fermentans ATCC 43279 = JCM 9966 = DSM 3133]GEN81455.1 hypothetical protein AFE02nite_31890 [Actinotalea fermentans]
MSVAPDDRDVAWRSAADHVVQDEDGTAIAQSQALWAAAVAASFPLGGDIRCDGAAFGPARLPDGRVVHRPVVAVVAEDPVRALKACRAAWGRFQRVDVDGIEDPDDGEGEAPDPFGDPALVGGQVLVGLDTRRDLEPLPHRAWACLLILAEELRAYGCAPCSISSVVMLPGDEPEAVGRDGRGTPASHRRPEPGEEVQESMDPPSWLPAFHRVERPRVGLPAGPVPFVMVVRGWVFAWDPQEGLLTLPGREEEVFGRVTITWECLSADGTVLHYERAARPDHGDPPAGCVRYDLATGQKRLVSSGPDVAVAVGGWPRLRHDWRSEPQRLVIVRSADEDPNAARALPLTDQLMGDLSGPGAQFSPDGTALLTSHAGAEGHHVAVTDAASGTTHRFEGVQASGSASWSPDGTRCLVSWGPQQVLDVRTGQRTSLNGHRFRSDDVPGRGEARALGWLDDDGVLVRQSYGRRVRLSYQPLHAGVRFPILDLPTPGAAAYDAPVYLASQIVRSTPESVGFLGP